MDHATTGGPRKDPAVLPPLRKMQSPARAGDGERPLPPGVEALVRRLAEHDPSVFGHGLRVACYGGRLAAALGLDYRRCRQLGLAARLHDIGKIAIPQAILLKPGALTAEEYLRVQKHPVVGECLLAAFIRSPTVLSAVRNHHECFDGRGYPDGLKGKNIPLSARIIAVADCFDALTSSRPYRAKLSWGEGLDHLRRGAGRQFDPELVQAFLAALTPAAHRHRRGHPLPVSGCDCPCHFPPSPP